MNEFMRSLTPKQTKGNPFIVWEDGNGNYYCNFRFEDANGTEIPFYIRDLDNGLISLYFNILPAGTSTVYLIPEINMINKGRGREMPLDWFTGLALGYVHSGMLTGDGKLYMWGANGCGQLGDGTTTDRYVPTLIPQSSFNNEKVVSLSLGVEHSGCITETGKLYMWGSNGDGQLGDETIVSKTVPTLIPQSRFNNEKVVGLSLGGNFSGCITETGKVYMWGQNNYGQLGDGTTTYYRSVPTLIPQSSFNNEKVVSLSLGRDYSGCITETGKLYMWGLNNYGQLGDGTTVSKTVPTLIPQSAFNNEKVVGLSLGGNFSGCITETGKLYMWGWNNYGQLGDGTTTDRYVPTLISQSAFNNEKVVGLSLGRYHSGCITETGKVYMWGLNSSGQLGDGTTTDRYVPTLIPQSSFNNEKVVALSLGRNYSGCITETGKVYMWGRNDYGQLGDGTTANKFVPTLIYQNIGDKIIVGLHLGGDHTGAITKEGKLYTWGRNDYYQLADGTTTNRSVPTLIPSSKFGNETIQIPVNDITTLKTTKTLTRTELVPIFQQ